MFPTVNQVLYFQIASSDDNEAAIEYKSRIADDEENCFLIEIPISVTTGRFKRLYFGDELSVYFLKGEGNKHYFDSHVIGFKEDGVRLIKIMKPDPERITKVQRRNFLRVPAELELSVKGSSHVHFVCVTDDVGGGGISFICDGKWPLAANQQITCWLLIPYRNGMIEHVDFQAEIVRIMELESGRKRVMIKFIDINDYNRQKIIRYCFEKQIEFRKR